MVLWWRIAQWAIALLGGVAAPTGIAPLARWACPPPEPQAAQGPSQVPEETVWVGGEGDASLRLWGARRLAVRAEGEVTFAADNPSAPLRDALSLGADRWLFLSADTVWASETFLGPIRPVARLEEPVAVVSRAPDRVIVRDGAGAYFAYYDFALVPQPVPDGAFAVAFQNPIFGLALTQGGGLWGTTDAGEHWARIDLGAQFGWRLRMDYRGVLVSLLDGRALLVTLAFERFATRDVLDGEWPRRTGQVLQPDARWLRTPPTARVIEAAVAPRLSAARVRPASRPPLPWLTVRLDQEVTHPGRFAPMWRRVAGFVGSTARHRAARVAETRRQPWRVLATREEGGVLEEILLRDGFEGAPSRWAVYAWRVSASGHVFAERAWVGDGPRAAVGIVASDTVDGGGIHLEMVGPGATALRIPWRGPARVVAPVGLDARGAAPLLCPTETGPFVDRVWFPRPELVRVRVRGRGVDDVLNVEAVHLARNDSGWCVAAVAGHVALAVPQTLHGASAEPETRMARILVAPQHATAPWARALLYAGPEGHLE